MTKRKINRDLVNSKDSTQITFSDQNEYKIFEDLILSGNPKDYQEAFLMLKTKTESKRRRRSQRDQEV